MPQLDAAMLLTFRNNRSKAAVVFVHGFNGDAAMSWHEFQLLLTSDPRAEGWDCFSFGYKSIRRPIQAVAADLYATVASAAFSRYEQIAFVVHSTGGLIVQVALLDHEDIAARVAFIFFFALPSHGFLAPKVAILNNLPIVGQLLRTSLLSQQLSLFEPGSPLLRNLSERWEAQFGQGAPFKYYSIAGSRDNVVLLGNLIGTRAEHRLVIDADHISIIKPTAAHRESVEIVLDVLNKQPLPADPQQRAEVVVELEANEKAGKYDVFLYYGPSDREVGRDIAQRLYGIGKTPWLLEWQGAGEDWWRKLMSDIERIASVAILFGARPAIDWRRKLLHDVINEFSNRKKRILPVLLSETVYEDTDLPQALQTIVAINWADADAFDQLVASIEGRALAGGEANLRRLRSRLKLRRRMIWGAITLASATIVPIVLTNRGIVSIDRSPFDVTAKYIGLPPYNKPIAVVFVHGIFGDKSSTWMNQTSSFPAMLKADPEFQDRVDVFVYEYFTPKFGNANSVVGLADQLRGSLEDNRVFDNHQRVAIVSHSMGGLVVRRLLLNKREWLPRVAMLYFFATPTNGSELTLAARAISSNPQLRGMLPLEGNDLLQEIQSDWLGSEAAKNVPSYCAYETLSTFGVTVVSMGSATALCNQALDPMTTNHIDIVKPIDRQDRRYTRLTHALRSTLSLPPAAN